MSADLADLPPVSAADYVAAVAQHVSSVCVITTACEGERFGLTATAVASVSASPARLLGLRQQIRATRHEKILRSGRFCVNVLTERQDQRRPGLRRHGGRSPTNSRSANGRN